MSYTPAPIDTSAITLSDELVDLVELLAEHVHDVWATLRMSQGWQFGPERHDTRKEHPGLVSYAELSETEKDYDRQTATEAIKVILSLGYQIVPPPKPAKRRSNKP